MGQANKTLVRLGEKYSRKVYLQKYYHLAKRNQQFDFKEIKSAKTLSR